MDVLWINLMLEMKNLQTQKKDQLCLKMQTEFVIQNVPLNMEPTNRLHTNYYHNLPHIIAGFTNVLCWLSDMLDVLSIC